MFEKKLEIYNCTSVHNNITYSIDMLRLKCFLTYNEYNDLDFYIRTYYNDKIKRYYISNSIQSFKYNYNIEIEEGKSFWFGFNHNTEDKFNERYEPKYNFTIEFNPNKLKDNNLIMHILGLSGYWYILQYDLAMDLRVNIRDLILDKSGKRKVHIFGTGQDDMTYEFGSKNDKRFKVYNKKREAGLNIAGDLTRIEMTRKLDNFPICDIAFISYDNFFPDVYLNQYVYSLSDMEKQKDDKTLYALLFAVQNGYKLSDLSRRYREKVKDLLEGGYKIRFDNKTANYILKRTILFYFLKNARVAFK